jgi:virulence-associated protein VagC
MTKATEKRAKLFKNGASQAVRLPKEFRFEGTEVHICRVKDGILLKPVTPQIAKDDWATVHKVLKSLGPESAEMMEATIQKKLKASGKRK